MSFEPKQWESGIWGWIVLQEIRESVGSKEEKYCGFCWKRVHQRREIYGFA